MRHLLITILLLLPALLCAQDFEFELRPDEFPVEINSWQPFQPWAGGLDSSTPEFCDIDADGDLDYFSGSSWEYVWYFKNNGSPNYPDFAYETFIFDSLEGVGIGALYESCIDFKDIDDDGDPDAFISDGIIGITTNNGNSYSWNSSGIVDTLFDQYGDYIFGIYFDVVDIDSDGDFDIMGGWQSPQEPGIRFYKNLGTPQQYDYHLITTNWQNIQVPELHQNPCFGDLDADGSLDLLVGTGEGNIYYYHNDGDSANAQMVYITNTYFDIDVGADASPELADIDGDGDLDLFVGCSPVLGVEWGDVYYFENTGNAQTPNFQLISTNFMVLDIGYLSSPRFVDIDADSDPDLLTRCGDYLRLYRNQGSPLEPHFIWESDTFCGITIPGIKPWFCDLDGDQDYDLLSGEAVIPGPPGLHLFINRGTAQIPDYVEYSNNLVPGVFTTSSVNIIPATIDIDADGDQDLFVTDDDGMMYFFENTGSPTLPQFTFITSNWQNLIDPNGGRRWLCFYDIDDDGDFDLFLEKSAPYNQPWEKNLRFYRNIGSPINPVMQLESEDLFPELMIWRSSPFLCDMDGDGDGDLFVGDYWGGIRYFKNTTGDTSTVNPPLIQHPLHGIEMTFGPNPANPVGVASFELRVASFVNLGIYDICGRLVKPLVSEFLHPGSHQFRWNIENAASGVYILRLQTEHITQTKRVVVLR